MSARQLIDAPSFGPDTLKVIGSAFDAAWAEICGEVRAEPVALEATRLKLANAVLSVASEDSCDVETLKRAALNAMFRMRP